MKTDIGKPEIILFKPEFHISKERIRSRDHNTAEYINSHNVNH